MVWGDAVWKGGGRVEEGGGEVPRVIIVSVIDQDIGRGWS